MKKLQDIKIDINAICEFEKLTGKSIADLKTDNFKLTDIRALISAGLSVDEIEAGRIMQEYMESDANEGLLEIISKKMEDSGFTKKKK